MGWARLDDGFHDHPKLIGLSLDSVGLWTLCFTWAHRHHGVSHGTFGHIPAELPARLGGAKGPRLALELERHQLWDACPDLGGWVIHDYIDYLPAADNPTTASEVRKARKEAGKRGAKARWDKQDASNLPAAGHSTANGKAMPPIPNPNQNLKTEQKTETPSTATPATTNPPGSGFDEFWQAYPRRVGKADATKAWARATQNAPPESIIGAARRLAADPNREDQFTPHPTTWLNRGGWDDDALPDRNQESATGTTTAKARGWLALAPSAQQSLEGA